MKSFTPKLKASSTIEDEANGEFFVRFCFRKATGKLATVELPRSDLSDTNLIIKKLLSNGAILPPKNERPNFVLAAADGQPTRILKRAGHSGWRLGKRTFVLQTRVLGKASGKVLGIRPPEGKHHERGWLKCKGTLSEWKKSVASPAASSSLMMLTISAGFAGPLIATANQQSFAICLSGSTRSGKSVATLVGGSVIGLGTIQEIPTWNATEAGLEQQLPRFRDCLFPIDDFESLKGTNSQKYQRIKDFAYGVAAGSEKQRHSSYTTTSNAWRTITVTSMENSIRDLAGLAGVARQGGETIRLIDVPQLSKSIFDRAEAAGEAITSDWKGATFEALTSGCAANCGVVFEKYLKKVCANPKSTRTNIRKSIAAFAKKVERSEDGDVARDVARKFGLIYAGGREAIRHKLLPWKREDLLEAIRRCYVAARDLLPDDGVIIREGQRLLRTTLEAMKVEKKVKSFDAENGYRTPTEDYDCVIKVEEFNLIFASTHQRETVLASLIKNNRIVMNRPKKKGAHSSPRTQFTWPDGVRRRSYKIQSPSAVISS